MDVSLDEILAERKSERRDNRRNNDRNDRNDRSDRNERGRGRRDRGRREDYPRDGVRKSYRDEPRKIDEEWVHDRYDNNDADQHVKPSRARASPEHRSGTRIRVENLHYDLTRDDLEGLFSRIGAVTNVELLYDRAGRSEGTAYVTYESHEDARAAVREFDGANAKGQPIRLAIVPAGSRQRGKAGAIGAGRPLADRISRPKEEGDEEEEDHRISLANAARRGIDRYVPGGAGSGRLSRSRSPGPRRREGGGGGRRPGERRGGRNGHNSRDNAQNGGGGGNRRPKKTQEELDAEMADYFVEGSNGATTAEAAPAAGPAAAPANDDGDEDMIL
ncbi:hypothetical protein SEUCBS140593_010453 [Sporothrix eucalyptigena]|uniref:RRM domain-containing protein n=1 Tax=Sporothrix eucalyptigena TaxID=1812306 RepID=A0ABP0D1E8_9PEZI